MFDTAITAGEAHYAAKHVGKWMRRKHRLLELSQLPGRGWVEYEPYGTVLIIGVWNFPLYLTFGQLVGAIAAGNTVVLKPSEICTGLVAVDGRPGSALSGLLARSRWWRATVRLARSSSRRASTG